MWARLRLDIGWNDLAYGLLSIFSHRDSNAAQKSLESEWSEERDDSLACLSLRSAFDLLLTALKLPRGSEVLFSAITIPDMPLIAARHGLIPVSIPVREPDFRVDIDVLKELLNERTKVIVVAQLFGNRVDLAEVQAIVGPQGVLIVEDCAQAWFCPEWRGSPEADASLFSFGMIKTATALGGGLARISDPDLSKEMRRIQATFPRQTRRAYLSKLLKASVLKLLAYRVPLSIVSQLASLLKMDFAKLLSGMTRGFRHGDILEQLRRQPSVPLLELMRRCLRTYPQSRILQRCQNAERIRMALRTCESLCLLPDCEQSHWLFPIFTDQAASLIAVLHEQGFDAAQRGSLQPVSTSFSERQPVSDDADALLKRMVFLPCYPELSSAEIDRMCSVIRDWWCSVVAVLQSHQFSD
ncbi:aminotransferase class I/II-fold pyridoxal phosphate-dependent enzyme [Planctomicrobium piriforme]|uniref:dTDP-4-amino-4,6-dideoxygalactose transaminase n=1 Tax=Planctomicrobium piriforme TaxID=1576369 RepID=A0A1I3QYV9_9PLAN|nr:aminotransferase class I/II-fold pyridoxal phosphate-dependent enzyme [Planctomicrobium piriforme]SFJ39065.1 dTDP-4-amino-4,6-dideoxygalactose transaminase [Planctomicrobium piriforme]